MRTHRRINPYRNIDIAAVTACAVICLIVGMFAIYAGMALR